MNREISRMFKHVINCQDVIIEDIKCKLDADNIPHIQVFVRPKANEADRCPICGRKGIKDGVSTEKRVWRHLDFGGCYVEIIAKTQRIICPDHGKCVAAVPWAYPGSDFTKDFDHMATFMALCLPKTVVSDLLRIDWKTVGRAVSRTANDLEPDRKRRFDNLKFICVDETSYKKGYKYITVVVNAETAEVVWIGLGYGKTVFERFCNLLTEEQRNSIKVVAGDGAGWIDDCMGYFPNAVRSVDPFHIVEWANEALDAVRTAAWNNAREAVKVLQKSEKQLVDRARKLAGIEPADPSGGKRKPKVSKAMDDEAIQKLPEEDQLRLAELRQQIEEQKADVKRIKDSRYALVKNPDHLTTYQQNKLEWIQASDINLTEAHRLKEELRTTIKLHDPVVVEAALLEWKAQCIQSGIEPFIELAQKIDKHLDGILNFVKTGISSAKSEAINNKIKLLVRKAHGFRNLGNMFDLIYLSCSNLEIPLPYRVSTAKRTRGFKNYGTPIPDIA